MHACLEDMNHRIARGRRRLVILQRGHDNDGQPALVPVISTEGTDDEPPAEIAVIAKFCPFCGERLRLPAQDGDGR